MIKVVKVNWFEVAIEDFNNLFLKKICKAEIETLNILGNCTYNIIFIY